MLTRYLAVLLAVVLGGPGCKDTGSTYKTTAELLRVHPFGRDPKAPVMLDLELKYAECPGEARKLIRGDKKFAGCALGFKAGDKLPVEVVMNYDAERASYRSEITRIGTCPIKVDTKDEANYEAIENCTEVKASGLSVGVRCNRQRDEALIAKCPWLRRN